MTDSNSSVNVWWTSEYNLLGRPRTLPESVTINDSTIREGEETPGVAFSIEEKIALARRLDEIGIRQIEVGFVEEEAEARPICQLGLSAKTVVLVWSGFVPNWREQIDIAAKCGADVVDVVFCGSPYFLSHPDNPLSEDETVERVADVVDHVHSYGLIVSISPMDTPRAEMRFLKRLYRAASDAGADRIRIVDTVGAMGPSGMRFLVRQARKIARKQVIGVHCHNDFGQALATTLAAYEEGAQIIDVTINGLGSRSGIADLAQVATAITAFYGRDTGLDLKRINELTKLVERFSRLPVPGNRPLAGELAFVDCVDFDIQGMNANPRTLRALSPEAVGNSNKIILGKFAGPLAVKAKLREMGISLADSGIDAALKKVRERSSSKEVITDGVIREIVSTLS